MKIVSIIRLDEQTIQQLSRFGNLKVVKRSRIQESDVIDAEIIIGNIPKEMMPKCEKLKFLQLESAGNENYIPYYREGLIICNASGTFGESIAEHLVMSTLMLFRNMDIYMKQQNQHQYLPMRATKLIVGSRVLIYGTGDLGQSFAKKLKSLGAKTIGVKRIPCTVDYFDEIYTSTHVSSILPSVDVVAFCLPKSEETTAIFKEVHMNRLAKDCIILNVGRSNAIDQNMIVEYLRNDNIGGAMLDVFDEEPIASNSQLWDCDRLLITPHVAGNFANEYTYQCFYEIVNYNVKAYTEGLRMKNIINRRNGY